MKPSEMTDTHLSNSVQFCLRKLKELEDADSYEFYYDRLVAVVDEMAIRELSPSPIPKWVEDKYSALRIDDEGLDYDVATAVSEMDTYYDYQ